MKKLIVLIFFISSSIFAQIDSPPNPNEGFIGGGLGMSWIDGSPYYTVRFNPELAFANVGIGLDLLLEFDSNGKIRAENFKEFSDYLRIIRYFRYGQKHDPVYFRVGALDYATLGHGSIMYLYNNSPSFDRRKIGMEFDVDFSKFGFEIVYGNFLQAGVAGLRGYVRPLQFTTLGSIPVIGGLEVGATYATDFDKNAGVISGTYNSTDSTFSASNDKGTMAVYGVDVSLPIVRTKMVDLDLYFDYSKIKGYGDGTASGIQLSLNGLGLLNLSAKLERRWNSDHYLPAYFNALYETERFNLNTSDGSLYSKTQMLENAVSVGNGFYGELFARVLGIFDILGSYQRLDEMPQSGLLHLSTNIAPESMPVLIRAGYDKRNIGGETEIFKLDERSHLFFETGYKPLPYIVVSLIYHWTFAPLRDGDDNVIGFEPQKRIEPSVRLVYPINL